MNALSKVALGALALGALAPFATAQSQLQRNNATSSAVGGGASEGGGGDPCGPAVITHSLNDEIQWGNSISCNFLGFHEDNYYVRSFTLADFGQGPTFEVCSVRIGIEIALNLFGSDQPIEVQLYNTADVSNLNAGTLIGSEWFDIHNQFLKHKILPISATTTTGELSVVIYTPDDAAFGNKFFLGTNDLGQTGPSYIAAPDCDVDTPTDLADLGFPDIHYVLSVRGISTGNDCNENGVPDEIDIATGTSEDCNENGIPDECDVMPLFDPEASVAQDHCEDAEDICPGIFYHDDTFGATATNGPLMCGNYFGVYDVYYRYVPATTGQVFVSVQNPQRQFVYSVHDGCPGDGGSVIACNVTNPTGLVFDGYAETPYYIRIAAAGFHRGPFVLRVLGPDCILNPNDVNGNGIPDECECPEDVDGSGTVDLDDYIAVLNAMGEPCDGCPEDVDGDGDVDQYDLMRIIIQLKSEEPCGGVGDPK